MREVEILAAQGVKEFVLISQDTTNYGTDLGLKDGLAKLVESIARVPGVEWTRPAGGYTLWLDVKRSRLDEGMLCARLLQDGVSVAPGSGPTYLKPSSSNKSPGSKNPLNDSSAYLAHFRAGLPIRGSWPRKLHR